MLQRLAAHPWSWGPVLVLTAVFLGSLAAFGGMHLARGARRTGRGDQLGGSLVLSRFLVEWVLWLFQPFVRAAVRLRLHPDAVSWTSLALHLAAAVLVARGDFGPGAWVLVFGALADAFDGAVARARGLASDAGEVLDAALDRWAEAAVFAGYAWYYRGLWWGFLLACAASAGAVLTSYARAKGQAYGVEARMGLMQRHERATWLCVATLASSIWEAESPSTGFARHGLVLAALGAIAVLSNAAGWSRTSFTRRELRRR
ncbi:MAG TPA: CDP-alcohol phosphatidyltransferase family protein [Anaeromyxobacteraceae bacterium]